MAPSALSGVIIAFFPRCVQLLAPLLETEQNVGGTHRLVWVFVRLISSSLAAGVSAMTTSRRMAPVVTVGASSLWPRSGGRKRRRGNLRRRVPQLVPYVCSREGLVFVAVRCAPGRGDNSWR